MKTIETSRGPVLLRELQTIDDMVAAEKLELEVWGSDIYPHPKELLIPVQHEGGLLAGAFAPDGVMIGLVFGFPTKDPAVMHSQMLGTREDWRGFGIGANLKWFQREWCLERGYQLVRWTVDPLRAANAELNIRHLGGTASTYYIDYYGVMPGIDAGAPTDRLLVEWRLDGDRVRSRIEGTPDDCGFPEAEIILDTVKGAPSQPELDASGRSLLMRLPANFIRLSKEQPELALSWRLQTRDLFLHYFDKGYTVTGFTRSGGPAYLLEIETRR